MRTVLPLSVAAVAVLSGCSTIDLKPITKPTNPRVIERELVAPQSVARRPVVAGGSAGVGKPPVDETGDLPVMPFRPSMSVPQKGSATPATSAKASTVETALGAGGKAVASVAPSKSGVKAGEDAAKGPVWQLKASDVRLATTFERWAKESTERGMPYSILWDAGKHVLIEAPTEFRGTFLDAVKAALKSPSILESDYPLEACEYPNTPPVIRVTRWGEQAKDCPDYL